MKPLSALLIFLVPASLATVLNRDTCNHDNCYRAVAGTSSGIKPSLSVRQSDCSSFMQTTITPNAVTTTVTTVTTITTTAGNPTSTTTTIPGPPPPKRTVTNMPTSIPSYAASSCASNPSRYSSACSCFSIPATTHTAPTPTITTSSTITSTVITTPSTPAPAQCTNPGTCSTYSPCGAPGSSDCFCGIDANNDALCFQDESCADALNCVANADCAGNGDKTFCLVNSCCGNGVCINNDTCLNPGSTKRMFEPRSNTARRDELLGVKVDNEVEMELFMTGLKPISGLV